MRKLMYVLALLASSVMMPMTANAADAPKASADLSSKYINTPTGFLMVLRQGDNVLQYLKQLALEEDIPSATISGIGFVNATLGYWDASKKVYVPKEFKAMELASLNGSIAWEDKQPSIHAHGVLIDSEFQAHGGHILDMQVGSGSVEITITVHVDKLERAKDKTIDANVLVL